jgi:putative endonuclease
MDKQCYVYIMTNNNNTVLYTGVTSDLRRRAFQHRQRLCKGFTRKYNIVKLVYYEILQDPYNAIAREKQIKAGSRKKKTELIESMNPEWKDLYDTL